jgi:hypothetical protein
MFFESELTFGDDTSQNLRCVRNDAMPSKINTEGMTRLRMLSLVHRRTKVDTPDKIKLVIKDNTNISNFEKYFVSLKIFKRAYPERPETLTKPRTNLRVPSPVLNRFKMSKIAEKETSKTSKNNANGIFFQMLFFILNLKSWFLKTR